MNRMLFNMCFLLNFVFNAYTPMHIFSSIANCSVSGFFLQSLQFAHTHTHSHTILPLRFLLVLLRLFQLVSLNCIYHAHVRNNNYPQSLNSSKLFVYYSNKKPISFYIILLLLCVFDKIFVRHTHIRIHTRTLKCVSLFSSLILEKKNWIQNVISYPFSVFSSLSLTRFIYIFLHFWKIW